MNDTKIGIIAAGAAYLYAKEALGDKALYLKLGFTYPLPMEKIKALSDNFDELYVIEELDPFMEEQNTPSERHGHDRRYRLLRLRRGGAAQRQGPGRLHGQCLFRRPRLQHGLQLSHQKNGSSPAWAIRRSSIRASTP